MVTVLKSLIELYSANGTYFISALTNSSGWADFINLANTTFNIRTFYQGIQVSNLTDTLSVQGQIRIVNAGIFDLIVNMVNEKGDNMPNVIANLLGIGTKTTNSTGYVVFENLPSTTYSIKVSLEGYRDKSLEIMLTSEDQNNKKK